MQLTIKICNRIHLYNSSLVPRLTCKSRLGNLLRLFCLCYWIWSWNSRLPIAGMLHVDQSCNYALGCFNKSERSPPAWNGRERCNSDVPQAAAPDLRSLNISSQENNPPLKFLWRSKALESLLCLERKFSNSFEKLTSMSLSNQCCDTTNKVQTKQCFALFGKIRITIYLLRWVSKFMPST